MPPTCLTPSKPTFWSDGGTDAGVEPPTSLVDRLESPMNINNDASEELSSDGSAGVRISDIVGLNHKLDAMACILQQNLKFTKALYRGTKRSLSGPGFESTHLSEYNSHDSGDAAYKANERNIAQAPPPPQHYPGPPHLHPFLSIPSKSSSSTFNATPRNPHGAKSKSALGNTQEARERTGPLHGQPAAGSTAHTQCTSYKSTHVRVAANDSGESVDAPLAPDPLYESASPAATAQQDSADAGRHHLPKFVKQETLATIVSSQDMHKLPPRGSQAANMSELTRVIMEHQERHSKVALLLWRFLEDKGSSKTALIYFRIQNAFLLFAIVLSCIEAFEWPGGPFKTFHRGEDFATQVQLVVEGLFVSELFLRCLASPHRQLFVLNFYNIVDLVSTLPLGLRVWLLARNDLDDGDSAEVVSLLGIVPVLRLLRSLRHFETFQLLSHAFMVFVQALPVLLFTQFLMVLSFAAVIYYCEPRGNIPSLFTSVYFVCVTLSTVGYGDFSPSSPVGKICSVLLMIFGPLYMAMPLGIVGTVFSEIWNDRHRLLLMQQMRNCVLNAGYTPSDLRQMFCLIDTNGDGQLDFQEFVAMLQIMEVDVKLDVVGQVFESFDADSEGTIDYQEFLRGLFPKVHWLVSSAGVVDDKT